MKSEILPLEQPGIREQLSVEEYAAEVLNEFLMLEPEACNKLADYRVTLATVAGEKIGMVGVINRILAKNNKNGARIATSFDGKKLVGFTTYQIPK